ncbi:MAG: fasciclin domain-containing protein [Phycisphaerales bacterium]
MTRSLLALATASLVAAVAVAQTTPPARPATPPTPPAKAPAGPTTGDRIRQGGEQLKKDANDAVKSATDAVTGQKTIVETAVAAGNFKTLTVLLQTAGLVETLNGKGPFTVFAPTDEAFAKLPRDLTDSLIAGENHDRLAAILKYHVVAGNVKAADAMKLSFATSLLGQRLDLKSGSGMLMVDAAKVTKADIVCSNGVIHVIDAVLMPIEGNVIEVARGTGTFATLLAALESSGMNEALKGAGPFTLLAPTDEAFRNLPKGTLEDLLKPENKAKLAQVLAAHVVPGKAVYSDELTKLSQVQTIGGSPVKIETKDGKSTIGGATLVKTDIEASNGVIQAINMVILPGTPGAKTAGGETTKPAAH